MLKVRKGNIIQKIAPEHLKAYIARGYDQITDGGTVIKKAVPSDVEELRATYVDYASVKASLDKALQENRELAETIETLKEENQSLCNNIKTLEDELQELKKKPRTKKVTSKE